MLFSRKHLPSLRSLATFEIAAKHLSFTLAAKELNVTQAAVSQQIRYLEDALEQTLFIRRSGSIELTPEGVELLSGVTAGLDRICSSVSDIRHSNLTNTVTVASTNAAAQLWLYPLVKKYRKIAPETEIVILGSDRDESIQNYEEVDIALICGNERSMDSEKLLRLFPEVVKPVCSPEFLKEQGPFETIESLFKTDLLHLHKRHWTANAIDWPPLTWQKWFGDEIVDEDVVLPGFQTNSYVLLTEAAKDGEGVMLGFQHLVESSLADGSLCIAFDRSLSSGRDYFLQKKVAAHHIQTDHVDDFISFILAETEKKAVW